MPKINLQWAIIPFYLVAKLFCLNAYSLNTVYHEVYNDENHSDGDNNEADDDRNVGEKQATGYAGISELQISYHRNERSSTQTSNICVNNHYRDGTIMANGFDKSGDSVCSNLHNLFRRQKLEAKRRMKFSIIGNVHVVALCTAYAIYHVYSVPPDFPEQQRLNLVRVIIDLTTHYAGLGLAVVLVVAALVNQSSLMKIINELFEIDELLLSRLGVAVSNERWLINTAALFLGFITFRCTINILSCRDENVKLSNKALLRCLIPQLVCLISELQYIASVLLIKDRFRVLNQVLAADEPSNANAPPKGSCQIVNRLLVETCHEDKAEIEPKGRTSENDNTVRQAGVAARQDMADRLPRVDDCRLKLTAKSNQLRHVHDIYLKLRKTIQMTNQSFGGRNLILILYQFVTVVEFNYMACIVGLRYVNGNIDQDSKGELVSYVLYAGCYLLELFVTCFYSHHTVDEMNTTNQLMNAASLQATCNKGHLLYANPAFRLNLLELHLHCLGLFNVDLSLFYGMIGAMTTYLIILIQFGNLDALR